LDIFNEIDYGPDENKTKGEIIARIGEKAHKDWEANNIVPPGWNADTDAIINNWIEFADHARAHDDNETILVVTSNGIARFAPYITGDYAAFRAAHNPKMATGGLSIFTFTGNRWILKDWNIKP
jgi:probable phosphoglycerate mutase